MASSDFQWAMVPLFLFRADVVPHSSVSVCVLGKCKADLGCSKKKKRKEHLQLTKPRPTDTGHSSNNLANPAGRNT